ncbi:MAG: type II and III secretion system family protein, partial [Pseudomonadota bacterium]
MLFKRNKIFSAALTVLALSLTACADVNVPDPRNVNIPAPATADERRDAVNEGPDSVIYLPLGEDVLVPEVLVGESLPSDPVGPFELRGETLAGALQLILAEYDISLAFETEEGLSRQITVANLKGDLDKVVSRVCSLADLYCA